MTKQCVLRPAPITVQQLAAVAAIKGCVLKYQGEGAAATAYLIDPQTQAVWDQWQVDVQDPVWRALCKHSSTAVQS